MLTQPCHPVRSNNKRALDAVWTNDELTMSTHELNVFLKLNQLTKDEVTHLRKARRRIRSRGYSADHRIKVLNAGK